MARPLWDCYHAYNQYSRLHVDLDWHCILCDLLYSQILWTHCLSAKLTRSYNLVTCTPFTTNTTTEHAIFQIMCNWSSVLIQLCTYVVTAALLLPKLYTLYTVYCKLFEVEKFRGWTRYFKFAGKLLRFVQNVLTCVCDFINRMHLRNNFPNNICTA